tara:strand:- start:248 stop:436 length:189 start_codon:yes stop_codon:yes gene_type:complete
VEALEEWVVEALEVIELLIQHRQLLFLYQQDRILLLLVAVVVEQVDHQAQMVVTEQHLLLME